MKLNLILNNVATNNTTGLPMPLLHNKGKIANLTAVCIDADTDEPLVNEGTIVLKNNQGR